MEMAIIAVAMIAIAMAMIAIAMAMMVMIVRWVDRERWREIE